MYLYIKYYYYYYYFRYSASCNYQIGTLYFYISTLDAHYNYFRKSNYDFVEYFSISI